MTKSISEQILSLIQMKPSTLNLKKNPLSKYTTFHQRTS